MKKRVLRRIIRAEIVARRERLKTAMQAAEAKNARANNISDDESRGEAQTRAAAEYKAFDRAADMMDELLALPELIADE